MSNDYNENELDDEYAIEYHDNESILANIAWQEFKRVCLKYIDVYADGTIKNFLKDMIIAGIKDIRKDDPESITDMNIDATALSLLIGATNEVIGTGLLEKRDADNMSNFINKCTQEQIKKGYRRITPKSQSKSPDKNNVKAICESCGKLVYQNYSLCEKCLKKKKALATFGVIVAFFLFNFIFTCISYYVAIALNLNSYFSLGGLFWCLLLPHLIKKARAKVDEKYKLKDSDEKPIAQPQKSNPSHESQVPPDIQFPKYTEEQKKEDERDKLLKRISELYRENEELKKRKPKKAFVAVIVVLSVLLATVSGFAVYQQTQIQKISYNMEWKTKNYESSIDTLTKEKDIYKTNWYDACDELMFYQYNVAIMTNNSMYYHVASCEIIKNALKDDAVNCFMLTVNAAKSKGYRPCPDCRTAESRTN